MSTGLRALDHAVELLYHPTSTEVPCRQMALIAAHDLFTYLPKYKANPKDEDTITKLQLASYASLGFMGLNVKGGLGLSHVLGYALGSPYSIPHGITSCMTLGHVVKLKASTDASAASQVARLCPFVGVTKTGDDKKDGQAVGDAILKLVEDLGLKSTLTEYKVDESEAHTITKTATRASQQARQGAVVTRLESSLVNRNMESVKTLKIKILLHVYLIVYLPIIMKYKQ
jgi:alcohol dehydrogenase class IV